MEVTKELILQPSVIVGILVLAGMLLQKKAPEVIFAGVIKAMLGFQTIVVAGRVIYTAVEPFGKMFQKAFHISGIVVSTDASTGLIINQYGTQVAVIMLGGLLMNLLLAKITQFRYVFTTGHHVLDMACILSCVINHYQVQGIQGYLIAVMTLGISCVLFPAILQKYTVKICGNDKVALGHFGSTAYFISAFLGRLYGDPEKSAEKIRIPKRLSFVRDTFVMVGITMTIMYMIVAAAAGKSYVESLSGGINYLVYAFQQALMFTVGFGICMTGVRWMLNEIVPAIRGFSVKCLPNARAAVDCPVVFGRSPNALIIGFVCSFMGGLTALVIMRACHLTMILPGIMIHFFCGGTSGVYGNSTGGIKGTVLGSFVSGIYVTMLPLLFLPHIQVTGIKNVTFADPDMGFAALLIGSWIRRTGYMGTIIILTGIIIIMVLIPQILKNRQKDTPQFMEDRSDNYK